MNLFDPMGVSHFIHFNASRQKNTYRLYYFMPILYIQTSLLSSLALFSFAVFLSLCFYITDISRLIKQENS